MEVLIMRCFTIIKVLITFMRDSILTIQLIITRTTIRLFASLLQIIKQYFKVILEAATLINFIVILSQAHQFVS